MKIYITDDKWTTECYPYIGIPNDLYEFLTTNFSYEEFGKSIGIKCEFLDCKIPQRPSNPIMPDKPIEYKNISHKTTTFQLFSSINVIFWAIPTLGCWIGFFSSLQKNDSGFFSIFIFFMALLVSFYFYEAFKKSFKTNYVSLSVRKSNEEYSNELRVWEDKCISIERQFKEKINEYNKVIEYYNSGKMKVDYEKKNEENRIEFINKCKVAKEKEYSKLLVPRISFEKLKPENLKRGKSELHFLSLLLEAFPRKILVDRFVNGYQPDFIYYCDITKIHIDIEVDEPYTIDDGKVLPIHYEDIDIERNQVFLNWGWFVLRFSEKQIVLHPKECIFFLKSFIKSIEQQSVEVDLGNLSIENRWTYEESLVFGKNKYRSSYS